MSGAGKAEEARVPIGKHKVVHIKSIQAKNWPIHRGKNSIQIGVHIKLWEMDFKTRVSAAAEPGEDTVRRNVTYYVTFFLGGGAGRFDGRAEGNVT